MTVEELVEKLNAVMKDSTGDQENKHIEQDKLLLEFINDERVTAAFDPDEDFWYA